MAKSSAVWGIDIGQCALKALRCHPHEEDSRIVADAFDYIEYPKILSQPEADPIELVREAIKTFLSRNSVKGDRVAISVSGQSGLARFIKLPPVESKKIPDIVKYEARQQIPFPLEDVIWDYQRMVGGSEEDGFAMEAEVGLFAMKREQAYKSLKPFDDAGIEIDYIQLAPLALYNYVAFDQMTDLPPPEDYDPDNPPESVVVLSLGTDTTELVVTNGFRVWQRSISLGGNHFTKALTKELKLTFASAEHLKRNAAQAEDPKAIFQAMRPVFSDLLTEVQRSINFFTNLDRRAKIGRAVALGNAMKLPGLQRYLVQNLGFELTRVESFRGLSGSAVTEAPAFKENVPAFGVCYGLCLQALRDTRIKTNLLPKEIIKERLIRSKKPWTVAAAAALLLGCAINYFFHYRADAAVGGDVFKSALAAADKAVSDAGVNKSAAEAAQGTFDKTLGVGSSLSANVEGRLLWLEVLRAVNLALPRDEGERPADIGIRNELHITSFDCVRMEKLEDWWNGTAPTASSGSNMLAGPGAGGSGGAAQAPLGAKEYDRAKLILAGNAPPVAEVAAPASIEGPAPADGTAGPQQPPAAAGTAPAQAAPIQQAPAAAETAAGADAAAADPGPKGPGFVIQLTGYHYHNRRGDANNSGAAYVEKTLLTNLLQDRLPIPPSERERGGLTHWPVKDLGILYPVQLRPQQINYEYTIEVPLEIKDGELQNNEDGIGQGGLALQQGATQIKKLPRYDFVVQFCWQEKLPSQREADAIKAAGGDANGGNAAGDTPAGLPAAVAPADGTSPAPAAATGTAAPPDQPAADGTADPAASEPDASVPGETDAEAENPVPPPAPPPVEPADAAGANN